MFTAYCDPRPPVRGKPPKDGQGPRGVPQTYYTSRFSHSTYRYAKFIKRLRAQEEETRLGTADFRKKNLDQQNSDFFLRCDRKALINDVARRVDICMQAFETDLQAKRQRLVDLFSREEKENIRKLVVQSQSGVDLIWEEKKERLKFLLDKRKKEHEEKYKEKPFEKCFHVFPCIAKIRTNEVQDILKYQMKEKEAMKMAELEVEKMWHEMAMKESEALAARMEQDAIERYRQDYECAQNSHYQIEQRKLKAERDRQLLIEETKNFKSMWEEDALNAQDAEKARLEKRKKIGEERKQVMKEHEERVAKKLEEEKKINQTWDCLATQGIADQKAEVELIKQKDRERHECNKILAKLNKEMLCAETANDDMFVEEARRRQEKIDKERCEYLGWAKRTEIETRRCIVEQMRDNQLAKEEKEKYKGQDLEYDLQLLRQLKELEKYKESEDLQKQKKYQQDLLDQIAYGKLLKERERQHEKEEIEKCKKEAQAYENEIRDMLCRPVFSERVHPFMRIMKAGIKMTPKCPCSKPDYCL